MVWMLAYRDRAHRDEVFARFRADPEWTALRAKYEVPLDAEAFMMSASDYSAPSSRLAGPHALRLKRRWL